MNGWPAVLADLPAILRRGPDDVRAYLLVGAILFSLGLFAIVTRRNAVALLMGVELVLNAANLNFAAFARFVGAARPGESASIEGQAVSLFVIVLAAAEAAIALALVFAVYHQFRTIDLHRMDDLRN